ncbi:hypothetical protein JAAARDRAFT_195648 [Jaapia argillacea MUCL 33604]|uniref:Uncharacterized protein n=1 Tax=Jaapia argillacea MUCL 33604 TaxID=933084 RepID=A0A067PPV2_9AGAM|nr:hypothetical protein JAAARDRAFT_195648 [Jaapia argillacea MUCL 33604]
MTRTMIDAHTITPFTLGQPIQVRPSSPSANSDGETSPTRLRLGLHSLRLSLDGLIPRTPKKSKLLRRPLVDLKLSHSSFLQSSISDDRTGTTLYRTEADGRTTSVLRSDAFLGGNDVAKIRWPDCWRKGNGKARISDILVEMGDGSEFCSTPSSLTARKFTVPDFPGNFKWKRVGACYQCTVSTSKAPVAILEPNTLSCTPHIRVYDPIFPNDSHHPRFSGVPIVLLDHLLVSSLLLLAGARDWMTVRSSPSPSPSRPVSLRSSREALAPHWHQRSTLHLVPDAVCDSPSESPRSSLFYGSTHPSSGSLSSISSTGSSDVDSDSAEVGSCYEDTSSSLEPLPLSPTSYSDVSPTSAASYSLARSRTYPPGPCFTPSQLPPRHTPLRRSLSGPNIAARERPGPSTSYPTRSHANTRPPAPSGPRSRRSPPIPHRLDTDCDTAASLSSLMVDSPISVELGSASDPQEDEDSRRSSRKLAHEHRHSAVESRRPRTADSTLSTSSSRSASSDAGPIETSIVLQTTSLHVVANELDVPETDEPPPPAYDAIDFSLPELNCGIPSVTISPPT